MDELHQFSMALLAVVFAAVMLVAGQLYIERGSSRGHTAQPDVRALSTAVPPRSFAARFGDLSADRSEMLERPQL
jgi:hypothetical protein